MKRINLLVALFAMVFAMASCDDDDDKVTYDQTYRVNVNATISYINAASPEGGISKLHDFYETELAKLNKTLKNEGKTFKITGRGETEELAKKNADDIIIKSFENDLASLNEKVEELKQKLEAKKIELAADILADSDKVHLRLTELSAILQRMIPTEVSGVYEPGDIMKSGTEFDFEAEGGENYAPDEPVDE